MTLANRVEGIIRNFLQEEDEHKVISKYCYPPLPRFDPTTAASLEGESPQDLQTFISFWKNVDLSHIYGFPLWEEGVFDLLHKNFEQVCARKKRLPTHRETSGWRLCPARVLPVISL